MSNTRGCFVKSGGPQLNLTNHTDALHSPHLGGVNNGVNSASLCAGVGHCANCPPTSWQVSLLTCSASFRIAIWKCPPPPRTLVPICHMPSKVESAMPTCHYATCHSCQHAMCLQHSAIPGQWPHAICLQHATTYAYHMCRAGSCCHLSSSFPGISFHCCCHRPPNIELQRRPTLACGPHICYRNRTC